MNLEEIKTLLAEVQMRIEELQKQAINVNGQLVRAQIQAESLDKMLATLQEWAGGSQPKKAPKFMSSLDH